MKKWWQSKILWVSVLLIAGGIAEFLVGVPAAAGAATIAAGIINAILRVISPPTGISGTPSARAR